MDCLMSLTEWRERCKTQPDKAKCKCEAEQAVENSLVAQKRVKKTRPLRSWRGK